MNSPVSNGQIFIAEIKTQSPFGFKSENPFVSLMELAITHGDWVSVHTNALWGGDFETVAFVRRNTGKPILAKGLFSTDDDIQRAFDHGADYALVVDRVPYPQKIPWNKCLFEIHNTSLLAGNLAMYPEFKVHKFVCNSRNLRTGLPKKHWELSEYQEKKLWTCQASGIRKPEDVQPMVNAFIVGEHLVDFCKAYHAIKA